MEVGKKRVRDHTGREFDGTVVEVVESTERFSDIKLQDGTSLRMKPVVTEVIRVDGQWDNEDNPLYIVRSANVMAVSYVAEALKKKVQ